MKALLVICLLAMPLGHAWAQETIPSGAPARPDTNVIQSGEQLKQTMATVGMTELPGLAEWERQKSAKVAVLSSAVFPGLGQAYNGRKWKAGIFAGLFTFYLGTAWVEHKKSEGFLSARDSYPPESPAWEANDQFYQFHKDQARDFVWYAGAVWFIGLLDAFIDAHLYDVRAVDPEVFESSTGRSFAGVSYGF